jgi:hypothetical protein
MNEEQRFRYLREKLIADISCPSNWGHLGAMEDLQQRLLLEWKLLVEKYQVDGEGRWLIDDYQAMTNNVSDLDEVESTLKNIEIWRPTAVAEYQARTRWLQDLQMATSGEYAKHFTLKRETKEQVIDGSNDGVSRFFAGIDAKRLYDCLMLGLSMLVGADFESETSWGDAVWLKLMNGGRTRVAFETAAELGAVGGQPTSFIYFEIDTSTPQAHAYPVTKNEALETAKELGLEEVPQTDDL